MYNCANIVAPQYIHEVIENFKCCDQLPIDELLYDGWQHDYCMIDNVKHTIPQLWMALLRVPIPEVLQI